MDEKIVAAYYKYMVDIAVLFGADRERATKELKDSLDFEMALANVSLHFANFVRNYSPTIKKTKHLILFFDIGLVTFRGTTKRHQIV